MVVVVLVCLCSVDMHAVRNSVVWVCVVPSVLLPDWQVSSR